MSGEQRNAAERCPQGFLNHMAVILALSSILKIWMLVDALRRGYCCGWPWIILAIPGGEVAYFFLVKFDDPQFIRVHLLLKRITQSIFRDGPGLKQLRYQARHAPTVANRLALARELIERHEYTEAGDLLQSVLASDSTEREARFLLAEVHRVRGEWSAALELLSPLVTESPKYRDHAAASALVEVLLAQGDAARALEEARALMARAPRTAHGLLLVRALQRSDLESEARTMGERILLDYEHAPWFQRRAERLPARALREISRGVACSRSVAT